MLEYFNADPSEYDVVFTANASGALKLVGEAFPFAQNSRFLLTYDNHNSVNGIREFARARGASVTYLPVSDGELRMDGEMVCAELARARRCGRIAGRRRAGRNLFAYPGAIELQRRPAPLVVDRRRAASTAGACSSTRPPSPRPIGSTSRP